MPRTPLEFDPETQFRCWRCKGIFDKDPDWNPDAEATERFGEDITEVPVDVVCDDCDAEIIEWMTRKYGPPPWPAGGPDAT